MTISPEPAPGVDHIVGERVHMLLWKQRMPQAALARALGIASSSMSRKLRGEIVWSASDIVTAAQVLGVQPGDLLPECPHSDSNRGPSVYNSAISDAVVVDAAARFAARAGRATRPAGDGGIVVPFRRPTAVEQDRRAS